MNTGGSNFGSTYKKGLATVQPNQEILKGFLSPEMVKK